MALKKLQNKPIIFKLIDELKKVDEIKKIIVSTPDNEIIDSIKLNYSNKKKY